MSSNFQKSSSSLSKFCNETIVSSKTSQRGKYFELDGSRFDLISINFNNCWFFFLFLIFNYLNFQLSLFYYYFIFFKDDNAAKTKMDSALKRLYDLHICSKTEKEKRFREKEKSTEYVFLRILFNFLNLLLFQLKNKILGLKLNWELLFVMVFCLR